MNMGLFQPKTIFYLLFFIFSVLSSQASDFWRKNYSNVDQHASSVKYKGKIAKLSLDLTSPFPDTIDKYRAIFYWVAKNIKYDLAALKDPELRKTKPEEVIKAGKGVCAGYANVFYQLCKESGLYCEIVSGWSKTEVSQVGKPLAASPTHAWNVISAGGKFYLCDVTWSAGYVTPDRSKYIHQFTDVYFCMPEQLFYYKHFPEDPKWLLNTVISKDDFIAYPVFWDDAFEAEITDVRIGETEGTSLKGVVKFEKNKTLAVSFTIDTLVQRVTVTQDQKNYTDIKDFVQTGDRVTFTYTLKSFSPYLLLYTNSKPTMGLALFKK